MIDLCLKVSIRADILPISILVLTLGGKVNHLKYPSPFKSPNVVSCQTDCAFQCDCQTVSHLKVGSVGNLSETPLTTKRTAVFGGSYSNKDGGGGGRAQLGESPTGGRDRTVEPFNPKT